MSKELGLNELMEQFISESVELFFEVGIFEIGFQDIDSSFIEPTEYGYSSNTIGDAYTFFVQTFFLFANLTDVEKFIKPMVAKGVGLQTKAIFWEILCNEFKNRGINVSTKIIKEPEEELYFNGFLLGSEDYIFKLTKRYISNR